MSEVMNTCIILYNMILEDEDNAIFKNDEYEITLETQLEIHGDEYMQRRAVIHNFEIHHELRRDLTDHFFMLNNSGWNIPPANELNS